MLHYHQRRRSAQASGASQQIDTRETVVIRLKCQFNKHRSRIDNILKTTAKRRLLEPERERPETITSENRLKAPGNTASAWPGQASMNFKTNPLQPRPTRRRRIAVDTFGWILQELSRHSEAIHCQPPEEPRACHPGGDRRSRKDNVAWSSSRSWWNRRTFGMARETRGEAASNTITATTSHQAP